MPRVTLQFTNGFYNSDTLQNSHQECVNLAVNIVQAPGALSPETLIDTAGISQILTTGQVNQQNRGRQVKAKFPYFLNGETLVRVDKSVDGAGVVTFTDVPLGTIPGGELVSTADNGIQLMVLVPGGKGYIINEDAIPVFQEITDPDFTANGNPQFVVFIDSFFVVTTDTKKFIKSASNDGLSWNALDFGTAEADPDVIVAPIVHRNRLYICGSETIEDFTNSPDPSDPAAFPFVRGGLVVPQGVFAPLSLIDAGESFLFVGGGKNEDPGIWSFSGNSAIKISTTAIDIVLGELNSEEVSNISSYKYGKKGAIYYCFKLPKTTFCYNTVTGRWHEEKSKIINNKGLTETIGRRVSGVVTAYGLTFCGDTIDGRIGVLDLKTFTEYEEDINRAFSTATIDDKGNVVTVSNLELTVNSGAGDFETIDPEVNMSKSINNITFNDEISRSMGKQGEYDKRLIWNRLGRIPRFAIFRFTKSAPVKSEFIKLEGNLRSHQIGT